ncbi:MAG TPA: carotenoid oxygenase family protein [Rhodopila sp.]
MAEDFSLDPRSNFGPIHSEYDLAELPVAGELPRELNGTLFRNGPNPRFPPINPRQHHWFGGDGMIHAFMLRAGRACYRNRWVRTDKWLAENAAGQALLSPFAGPSPEGVQIPPTGVANTNIIWHAGRLLALEEAHLPFEIAPGTLATRGVQNFDGALGGPFTAHPKIDPVTGELVFFGYSASGPLTSGMSYGTLGADGRVTRFERFEAPYSSMVHDFAVTERHVLFPVLPLSGSLARARAGQMPYAWEPELGAHIGLMTRDRGVASLRWFRAENGYVFHVLNAWDEGHRVIADVMQYAEAPLFPRADGRPADPAATRARLTRWTLDPEAGTDAFSRVELDDVSGEFPRLDERRAGMRNRFGLFVGENREDPKLDASGFDAVVWLDLVTGCRAVYTLPRGDAVSEAVFVPRGPLAAEGDGWLLAVAWRGEQRRSDLIVLDTQGVDKGPVATVQLAHRVPFGFHGNWVGDAA